MSEMFLKFTPEVKGESKTKDFEGWIEVTQAEWESTNPTSLGNGGGAGAGRAEFGRMILTLYMDASTVFAFKHHAMGRHFEKAKLVFREAGGSKPLEYWTQELFLVFVEKFQYKAKEVNPDAAGATRRNSERNKPEVTLTLAFGATEMTYQEQSATGDGKKHGPVQWSQMKNDPSTNVS